MGKYTFIMRLSDWFKKLFHIKPTPSAMMTWAKKEVDLACKKENPNRKPGEWDYGCACYESALDAFRALMGAGHSGFSISITQQILNRLLDGKPLTSIEDTPDIWSDIREYSGRSDAVGSYQCLRMSSLFKYIMKDGTYQYTDVNRIICVDINDKTQTYSNGLITNLINSLIPITMPYFPCTRPIKVYAEDFLVDQAKGDYDTKGVFYAIMPDGKKKMLNKFYKETDNIQNGFHEWVEIPKKEYLDRKLAAELRTK